MVTALALLTLALPQSCCDMVAFARDPQFQAAHASPEEIEFQPRVGKVIHFRDANGKPASGYWTPPRKGARAAVIMVHEWWGLNDHIRREAERLRERAGYAVLAIDLYEGKVATEGSKAADYMEAVDPERARAIVRGAILALDSGKFGFKPSRIGSIGFCFGGGWAFTAAIEGGPKVHATAIFYGMPDMSPGALARVRAKVLMIHPTQDRWITDRVVADFSAAMKKAGRSLDVRRYDAGHAFANPSTPTFNDGMARQAWNETLAFFKKTL